MTPVVRYPDWQARLIEYLARNRAQQFKLGHHDCALFAAGAVHAMTGTDLAAGYHGEYETLRGGLKRLKRAGFDDHVDLARACLPPRPVSMACPGDVAVVPTPDGDALGIVQGENIYVLGPNGLSLVPLTAATAAMEV